MAGAEIGNGDWPEVTQWLKPADSLFLQNRR
jgi:hypothetical protein